MSSSFIKSESVCYIWHTLKDKMHTNNPHTEDSQKAFSMCFFFSFSSVELQQAMNIVLLNVLLVCELKETISSTIFKYDG